MPTRENLESELKEEIKRLHSKGSADHQTLMRQSKKLLKPVTLNEMQVIAAMSKALILAIEAGRGGGKSSILSKRMVDVVTAMPRSINNYVGPSYKHLLSRTLPSTKAALEMLGYYEGLHYFVGKTAPKSWKWDMPYQAPNNTKNFIHFWTGAGYTLISQDVDGDGRGLNTDSAIAEEATQLKKDKYDNDVSATVRGSNKLAFEGKDFFLSEMFVGTTAISALGAWYEELEQQALLSPDKVHFLKFPSYVNYQNLGAEWFSKMKRLLLDYIYDAEIRNIRHRKGKSPFYPLLSEKHFYDAPNVEYIDKMYSEEELKETCLSDSDLDPHQPIHVGVDWGGSINCGVVGQDIEASNEFRINNAFFVKSPKILDDLMDDIGAYYEPHPTKEIYLWYDNTGNNNQPNSRLTYAEQARKVLDKYGFSVHLMTHGGTNPRHPEKYMLNNILMKEDLFHLPRIRFNSANCRILRMSLERAQVKTGKSSIEKDKSSERKDSIARELATDFSDAFDALLFGKYENYLDQEENFIANIYGLNG